jgi:hypothetical protein
MHWHVAFIVADFVTGVAHKPDGSGRSNCQPWLDLGA